MLDSPPPLSPSPVDAPMLNSSCSFDLHGSVTRGAKEKAFADEVETLRKLQLIHRRRVKRRLKSAEDRRREARALLGKVEWGEELRPVEVGLNGDGKGGEVEMERVARKKPRREGEPRRDVSRHTGLGLTHLMSSTVPREIVSPSPTAAGGAPGDAAASADRLMSGIAEHPTLPRSAKAHSVNPSEQAEWLSFLSSAPPAAAPGHALPIAQHPPPLPVQLLVCCFEGGVVEVMAVPWLAEEEEGEKEALWHAHVEAVAQVVVSI